MMKQLKIKDNSFIPKSKFDGIQDLANQVSNKTLLQLEKEGIFVFPDLLKDAEDVSRDQMILQRVNDSYLSGNIMGFIGRGSQRLVIESRFSKGENDFLFQYLLEKVVDFPNVVNLKSNIDFAEKIFNLLVFLFPKYLREAMRKGLYKKYVRREYNDENIRGSIDVARHIRKNLPFVGNVAYNQREYSYDNYIMELVRHAIEYINRKSFGKRVLRQVKEEVKLVIQATPEYEPYDRRKIINQNKKNTVRHAYYKEYRELQQLCLLILQNQEHYVGSGNRKIYGVLFDGAWLWEEYINLLISDYFYHPMNKAGQGRQYLFNGNRGKIYPDFIGKDSDNRIIADAKYKPVDNIGNKDYLQILAYMFRFDSKKAYYLYPESSGGESQVFWLNKGSSYENIEVRSDISVIKYGLRISDEDRDYYIFTEEMKKAEADFINVFEMI